MKQGGLFILVALALTGLVACQGDVVDLTYDDEAPANPADRTDCYYVRLVQHNGQRAWSSPIWVESG